MGKYQTKEIPNMNKKPILIIKVKVVGEVYDRVYGIKDIEHIVDLFNEIHSPQMKVTIESVQEERNEN